jgi:hypothetical protein
MRRFTKLSFIICIAVGFIILPLGGVFAQTEETAKAYTEDTPSFESIAADLVFARPLGIASTILGGVVYVVALPFSLPGGNSKAVWHTAVVKPAVFTFVRPLGDFD